MQLIYYICRIEHLFKFLCQFNRYINSYSVLCYDSTKIRKTYKKYNVSLCCFLLQNFSKKWLVTFEYFFFLVRLMRAIQGATKTVQETFSNAIVPKANRSQLWGIFFSNIKTQFSSCFTKKNYKR